MLTVCSLLGQQLIGEAVARREAQEHHCTHDPVHQRPPGEVPLQSGGEEGRGRGGRDGAHDRRRRLREAVREPEDLLVRRAVADVDEDAACGA